MAAVKFERIIDQCIGRPLVSLAGIFSKDKSIPKSPSRAAFIKLWAIGDSVAALPAIRAFKHAHPHCHVGVVCRSRNKAVFERQPFIDEIIELEPRHPMALAKLLFAGSRSRYDVVFDFEPYLNLSALIAFKIGRARVGFASQPRSRVYTERIEFSKSRHMVETYLLFVDAVSARRSQSASPSLIRLVPIVPSASDAQMARWFLESHALRQAGKKKSHTPASRTPAPGGPIIAINATISESSKSRAWPMERYAKLAAGIAHAGGSVVFIGGRQDKQDVEKIIRHAKIISDGLDKKAQGRAVATGSMVSAAGLLSIPQSAALIEQCDAFVGNDSGPMHLSAAMGTPTIGLFGPNTPAIWRPYGPAGKMVALYHKVWCSPCILNVEGKFPECFNPDYQACMKLITVKEVEAALQQVLVHGSRR